MGIEGGKERYEPNRGVRRGSSPVKMLSWGRGRRNNHRKGKEKGGDEKKKKKKTEIDCSKWEKGGRPRKEVVNKKMEKKTVKERFRSGGKPEPGGGKKKTAS